MASPKVSPFRADWTTAIPLLVFSAVWFSFFTLDSGRDLLLFFGMIFVVSVAYRALVGPALQPVATASMPPAPMHIASLPLLGCGAYMLLIGILSVPTLFNNFVATVVYLTIGAPIFWLGVSMRRKARAKWLAEQGLEVVVAAQPTPRDEVHAAEAMIQALEVKQARRQFIGVLVARRDALVTDSSLVQH